MTNDEKASTAPIEEVRAVWEVNVFGPLAVYQAMLPLLRKSSDARIVNVTSALGSLTTIADPAFACHSAFEPVYAASKTALNAVTLSMMIELEATDTKVNLVSPGFANTALVNFEGTESVEDAAREVVRVACLGPNGPTGPFTLWEGVDVPW
ncbi:SDR family NAD(P)-dependent oxidoreductase [Streptomyces violaceusniger]|uniref:SDR family NAD(P)-dependent oxidoreductase n=1 Tax=Streptomyces violaceusniger TaxID=68280 RepID=UPI00380C8285